MKNLLLDLPVELQMMVFDFILPDYVSEKHFFTSERRHSFYWMLETYINSKLTFDIPITKKDRRFHYAAVELESHDYSGKSNKWLKGDELMGNLFKREFGSLYKYYWQR